MNIEAAKRWSSFERDYQHVIPTELINIIDTTTDVYLPVLYGFESTNIGLHAIYTNLGISIGDNNDVHDLSRAELSKFPMFSIISALVAYAHYGLIDQETCEEVVSEFNLSGQKTIVSFVETLEDFFGKENPYYFVPSDSIIKTALNASRARLVIDFSDDRAVVRAPDLAALLRIGVKSIQNLMAPNKALSTGVKDLGIPVGKVKKWLTSRKSYRWTLLNTEEDTDHSDTIQPIAISYDDIHFVPLAPNGTWFSPQNDKDGQYVVGSRNNETYFNDYMDALKKLSLMEIPMWRELSANGRWIEVIGNKWIRKTGKELGLTGKEKIS